MEPLRRGHVEAGEARKPLLRGCGGCPDPGMPAEQQMPAQGILIRRPGAVIPAPGEPHGKRAHGPVVAVAAAQVNRTMELASVGNSDRETEFRVLTESGTS